MGECSGYIFTPHLAKSSCILQVFGTYLLAPHLTLANSTVLQVVVSGKTVSHAFASHVHMH